jgi:hypothetical protein
LDYSEPERTITLQLVKRALINQEIILQYTLIDEYLSDIICNYYFRRRKNEVTYRRLWREEKFQIFNHFIIEEAYFLQKLRIVHAIEEVPSEHRNSMEAINALRNAIAHSFFPENRRQYKKHNIRNIRRWIYDGEGIYTKDGVEKLLNNTQVVVNYLQTRSGSS